MALRLAQAAQVEQGALALHLGDHHAPLMTGAGRIAGGLGIGGDSSAQGTIRAGE
jgi:hypothetical protein